MPKRAQKQESLSQPKPQADARRNRLRPVHLFATFLTFFAAVLASATRHSTRLNTMQAQYGTGVPLRVEGVTHSAGIQYYSDS